MADQNDTPIRHSLGPMKDIPEVNPVQNPAEGSQDKPKVTELAPLSRIGFFLSQFILWIISAYVLFLIIFLLSITFRNSNLIDMASHADFTDSIFARKLQWLQAINTEKKNNRDFIQQISQVVLLNLLLPILTAILGYIFGSKEGNRSEKH